MHHGTTVMSGDHGEPLLVLDRVGKGRVAQLLSDQMWLWARGFEGGGPQAELLRRLAYWLMKEPDLEENDLRAAIEGDRLIVTRQSLEARRHAGHGDRARRHDADLTLTPDKGGRSTGTVADHPDGPLPGQPTAPAPRSPPPARSTRSSSPMSAPPPRSSTRRSRRPAAALFWVARTAMPEIRRVGPGRAAAGHGWMGFRANGDYVVTGFSETRCCPGSPRCC